MSNNNIKEMSIRGEVSVTFGNIIAIKFNKGREYGLELAKTLIIDGFDSTYHKLVIPKTPFIPNTEEHWPDKGIHITIAQNTEAYPIDEYKMKINGRQINVKFNSDFQLFEGKPINDEAVGCVYYVGLILSDETIDEINKICEEVNIDKFDSNKVGHISIAGISPIDDDYAKFREEYCLPYPETGFPAPIKKLTLNQDYYGGFNYMTQIYNDIKKFMYL